MIRGANGIVHPGAVVIEALYAMARFLAMLYAIHTFVAADDANLG